MSRTETIVAPSTLTPTAAAAGPPDRSGIVDALLQRLMQPRVAAWLIALVAIVVYANSVANEFAYDDWWIIFMNERLHQLTDLGQIIGTPYWPNFGEKLGLYRPLTVLFFAVQWVVSGGEPWLFHLMSVLMHAGVSVLVWALLRHFGSPIAAFAGALLFALHPLHTEAVANIVGQAELWAGLSVVGASVVFLGRRPDEPLSLIRLLAIAALYAIGLLAKENSIVLPGILVALELARRPMPLREYVRRNWTWVVAGVALLTAVALTYLTIRYNVLGSITGQDAGPQYPFLREEYRIFSALRAWPEYMRLLFFPADLSADYSPGVIMPVEGMVTPMMLLGAVILLALVMLAIATPWRPRAGLAAAWFFICILPVSNLLFPIGVLLAERVLYLPSVALGFVLVFAWDEVAARHASTKRVSVPRVAAISFAVAMLWLGLLTWVRNPDWKTSQTVVDSIIRDHPESYRAQWNAGAMAYQEGDTVEAIYHWELAHRMWNRDSQLLTDIASYYLQTHQYERARQFLRPAFEMNNDVIRTVAGLAIAELGVGNLEASLRVSEHGLEVFGAHPIFFDLRARTLLELDKPLHAAASWRTAIRLGADGWVQWAQLARALDEADSTAAAVLAVDSAIALVSARGDTLAAAQLRTARAGLLE